MAKFYFFPLYHEDLQTASNSGLNFILNNQDRLVESQALEVVAGEHTKGLDYLIYNNKCFMFDKSFTDVTGDRMIIVGKESISSADIVETS